MGKVPALVSHECCHELAGATQGTAICVSLVNEHWSKMRKCEVLLRQSIRERRSSLGTGARGSCSSSVSKARAAFPHIPAPVAALNPDDSIAPAGAMNTEMSITDTERTDLIQGPAVFQAAGLRSNQQAG